MTAYVDRDANGKITGFYRHAQDHQPQAIAEDAQELLAFLAGTPDLATARARAKARVDAEAEQARLAFITNGAGQALVYEAKRRAAADCLANYTAGTPPAAGVYPMLDAEIGITLTAAAQATADAYEVAVVVDAMATAWIAAGAAIETIRRGAKRDLETAADQAAIDAIIAGLVWPQP